MYYAIALICGVLNGEPQCLEAHDSRGPYDTTEACVERIGEMATSIHSAMPWMMVKAYQCKYKPGV